MSLVVIGRVKLVPVGGSTKPTETNSVSSVPKLEMTKLPGSWPAKFFTNEVGGGEVTDGVAAMAKAIGRDAMVRTFEVKRKSAVNVIFVIRGDQLAKQVPLNRIIILE